MIISILCLVLLALITIYDIIYLVKIVKDPVNTRISLYPPVLYFLALVAVVSSKEIAIHVISVLLLIVRNVAFLFAFGELERRIEEDFKRSQWGDD